MSHMSPPTLKQYLPPSPPSQRYYTLQQVTHHNTANDCWVMLFGQVYSLTNLIQINIQKKQVKPLIAAAGSDITYWFDTNTREPRTKVNTDTGQTQYYCPSGQYLQLKAQNQIKWWKDMNNIIGKLTKKSRKIQISNMLTDHTTYLNVPTQQTINQILTRYLKHNKHGGSYTWKRLGRPLDMEKTLTQNGIQDQDFQFQRLGVMKNQWYIPTIHLFFNDDLTAA